MSFYDMLTESKENQFKWFVKLSETHGLEAANKYAEILSQIPLHLESVMSKPPMGMSTPSIPNPDLMFENLMNGPAPGMGNLLGKKDHLPNESTSFLGGNLNVPTISNRNGSDHSSIANLNDLLNTRQNDHVMQGKKPQTQPPQPQLQPQHPPQPQPQPQAQPLQQQSVPLYQRQAGTTFNIQSNNMQMPMMAPTNEVSDHNLFENLFNHNGGLSQGHISTDLHGNAQHFQGLPPLQSFVSPVKPLTNSVHLTQK